MHEYLEFSVLFTSNCTPDIKFEVSDDVYNRLQEVHVFGNRLTHISAGAVGS